MSSSWFLRAALVGALTVPVGPTLAHAAEYYVAPTGSDSAAGTVAAPFATLSKANGAAAAGDTIWVHGGTYYLTTQLVLSKSGTSNTNRTKIWAVAGETPILDASKYVTSNPAADVPVVFVKGSWMHLRGLEIGNAKVGASKDHSYSLVRTDKDGNASNNTFDLLNLHHGFGPGLFIDTGSGGNLIVNCDSHDNYDRDGSQGDGQNGDGFGVHYQTTGPSTVIRACRAWSNSDDGYDLISQEVPVIIEQSFAMSNGRGDSGNGNGFKIGSSKTGIRHTVRNNVAWKNVASGFYANHSTGGNTWHNNTSYMNGTQYDMLASSFDANGKVTGTIILTGNKAHIMRNNIGFPNKNANMGGVDTADNTWDLGIAEASTDFASTSDANCTEPRGADGSIPSECTFVRLKADSPLLDRGVNVGLPYMGTAPDLGAYEYGAPTTGAGGGTTGAGGFAGAAGGRGGTTGATAGNGGGSTGGQAGGTGIAGRGGAGGVDRGGIDGGAGRAGAAGGAGGTAGPTGIGGGAATRGGAAGRGELAGTGGAGPHETGGTGAPGTGGARDAGAAPGCACAVTAARDPGVPTAAWVLFGGAPALVLRRRRHRQR